MRIVPINAGKVTIGVLRMRGHSVVDPSGLRMRDYLHTMKKAYKDPAGILLHL